MSGKRSLKRFYTSVSVEADGAAFAIALDGKRVRTPQKAALILPSRGLAEAIADEWQAQGENIEPQEMRLTGLANAAIDRIGASPGHFIAQLCQYLGHDLICYHAPWPQVLAERQAKGWMPWLGWLKTRHGISLRHGAGVEPIVQDQAQLDRLREVLAPLTPFELTGTYALATALQSVTLALGVLDRALAEEEAFALSRLDEAHQAQQWGEDAEAVSRAHALKADVLAASLFLALLR